MVMGILAIVMVRPSGSVTENVGIVMSVKNERQSQDTVEEHPQRPRLILVTEPKRILGCSLDGYGRLRSGRSE